MEKEASVEKAGNAHIIKTPDANVFAVTSDYTDYSGDYGSIVNQRKVDWEEQATIVMGKRVVPYGENNNLPDQIRQKLAEEFLFHLFLKKKKKRLYIERESW